MIIAPPTPGIIRGADFSAVQGLLSEADVLALVALGVKFVDLRAVVGNEPGVDAYAIRNAAILRAHGIKASPYLFPYPLLHLSPEEQAEHFVRKLARMGLLHGDLPIMYDAEWPPREKREPDGSITLEWKRRGLTDAQQCEWHLRCLRRIRVLTGVCCRFYSFPYHLDCMHVEVEPEFALYELVLAFYAYAGRWATLEEYRRIKARAPWKELRFIQVDGNGGMKLPVSGIDADFDVFLGTEDELADRAPTMTILPELPELSELPELNYPIPTNPAVRQSTLGLITDDMIRDYRRTQFSEAA